ncbi:MAG: nucleotidyltransferase domain-containing protein [Chitinivibrionales bacterium]|nr:nucleotidyltransferase domain-containing protein [Chitinivibrionales bacterium]
MNTNTDKHLGTTLQNCVSDYKNCLGETVRSIVLYGSAATAKGDYVPNVSDINLCIIVTDSSLDKINSAGRIIKKWQKNRVSPPFFMTLQFITSSTDSYPLEFLDMQSAYQVLFGSDDIGSIQLNNDNIRLQCERELKGMGLHLRTAFLTAVEKNSRYREILSQSIKRLLPVLRGLLKIKGIAIPVLRVELVREVEKQYGLPDAVLSAVCATLRPAVQTNDYGLSLFSSYTQVIDSLANTIEHFSSRSNQ